MSASFQGHCLCGDVEITLSGWTPEISVCHCSTCRRAGGGFMAFFEAPAESVTVSGEVGRFRASHFAERTFCPRCGANLWLRDDGGDYEFSPGLFDAAGQFPLIHEIYVDCAHRFATFAGDHPRITRADYESHHPHAEADR